MIQSSQPKGQAQGQSESGYESFVPQSFSSCLVLPSGIILGKSVMRCRLHAVRTMSARTNAITYSSGLSNF